tara:strand:- start:345 stop:491 length:147 start_codon:yes stop_codon:yes gene_type:complete
MDKLKKKNQIKAPAPEAYLYEKPKSERKVTDKDLFVMPSKLKTKTKKK